MDWINNLPEMPGEKRDNLFLKSIESGMAICQWSEIESTYEGHVGKFQVNTDAVYIEYENGRFRFPISAKNAQIAADMVGGMFLTTKIMDLRHLNSNKLNATLLNAGPNMSSTTYSKDFNNKIEIKRKGFKGIVSDCGKPWILDNKLSISAGACLYGFYDVNANNVNNIGLKLWQNVGTKHNNMHQDYSSTLLLMEKICEVDNVKMEIKEIAKDKILSNLINYNGILNYVRGL